MLLSELDDFLQSARVWAVDLMVSASAASRSFLMRLSVSFSSFLDFSRCNYCMVLSLADVGVRNISLYSALSSAISMLLYTIAHAYAPYSVRRGSFLENRGVSRF
jgi:hypothetical protein